MQESSPPISSTPLRGTTLLSVVTLIAVLSPILQNFADKPIDGFPLSYFPMFTAVREGRTTLTHPVGFYPDGTSVDLNYRVAGSGGMNQVRRQIRERVKNGEASDLCREIAQSVRTRWMDDYPGIVEVAIVRDRFFIEEFFAGNREPYERKVRARVALDQPPGEN